jgi:hypothetical protein
MFTIPRPGWVSDALVAECGTFAGFQMYSREANNAVGLWLQALLTHVQETGMLPKGMKTLLREGIAALAVKYPEVHDTEPEWAIVDAVNAFCDSVGFARIDRDDLFW